MDQKKEQFYLKLECVEVRFPYVGNALGKRHKNPDGSIGGWVAITCSVDSTVYIGYDCFVCEYATISDNAQLLDDAIVSGFALVKDQSIIEDSALVTGGAIICGQSRIGGNTIIDGDRKFKDKFVFDNKVYT